MSINPAKLTSFICLGAFLMLPACTPKDSTTGDESTTQPETTTTDTTPTGGKTETTAVDSTTTTTDGTVGLTGDDTSTTDAEGSSSSTGPAGCPDPENQENGLECTDDSGCGCSSGSCFLVPILGGWCGECRVDSDCPDGGCTVPNPLAGTGSVCNLGKPGDGCMTGDVCFVPIASFCAPILVIPGIIEVATCSECGDNGDCPNSAPNCTPDYNILSFTGIHTCVPNASVPQDGGCSLVEDGDKACDSGFCGEANVMGLLKVGICGECNSDQDCGNNQSCTDPVVDLASGQLIGSICQ